MLSAGRCGKKAVDNEGIEVERSISLQERPMKEPTLDTEERYGDGAARTKVRSPKPKALFYHVCSNRIELLFQNGEHKVALVRSAIKQVAKRSAIGEVLLVGLVLP
ncbi:hypothetical protein L1987_46871 [Smallanthus sonchifolius]|uniref:Uncharacterized protein n=1 Tax=Smallanthus sonchifolius TaxID=185202 RepID=A0ACB9G0T1_9ASTR|nr:hypothetical protein L1987_46871 [Smallanthus sonchifolius]